MAEIPPLPRIRVAAAIVDGDRLLLVRHEKAGHSYWMLPGGGVDHGESLAAALQRELREELCLEAAIGPVILVNDSIPDDCHRHIVNLCFRAKISGGVPTVGGDPRVVEAAYHPLERLETLPLRPDFGQMLRRVLEGSAEACAPYLGNLWRD